MEDRNFREDIPTDSEQSKNNRGHTEQENDNYGAFDYIQKNLDMEDLVGDIRALVAEKIQNTIPDEKKLMMDLVSQVGALTGEVKQLRQQLDTKPYSVYACPSGQIKDIKAELEEIKLFLEQEAKTMELPEYETEHIPIKPNPIKAEITHYEKYAALEDEEEEEEEAEEKEEAKTEAKAEEEASAISKKVIREELIEKVFDNRDDDGDEEEDEPEKKEKKKKKKKDKEEKKEKKKKEKKKDKPKEKSSGKSFLGNLLFYVAIIALVGGAFLAKSGSGGQPTVIAGFSAFTVLSSSMEDTYPKGSLIVTHQVDADELEIGDDITYMVSATSSITHRIIGITENYLSTGARAFETQGTMNEKADKDPVAAANVVGKVIFCSVALGRAATFVSANWPILLFFVVVICALIAFLKWNMSRDDGEEKEENEEKPKKAKKHGKH